MKTLRDQIQFKRCTIFLKVRFRKKKGLMLDMGSSEDVQNALFKHWHSYPSWGYVHINTLAEFRLWDISRLVFEDYDVGSFAYILFLGIDLR